MRESRLNPLVKLRRKLLGYLCRLPDTGYFGLTPLRTHIVVCGFRRSGTTLLQMMLGYALPHARQFDREVSAWRAATYRWRNHEVMISKAPDDLFKLNWLRDYYRQRAARLRTVILIRDPRDMLTSRHPKTGPDGYFVELNLWMRYRNEIGGWLNSPDVLLLRYEDLVTDTAAVQTRIEAFTGEPGQRPFADFHLNSWHRFEKITLNGLRAVESDSLGRWRHAEHRARIEEVLRFDPSFAEALVDLGYESSKDWVRKNGYDESPLTEKTTAWGSNKKYGQSALTGMKAA